MIEIDLSASRIDSKAVTKAANRKGSRLREVERPGPVSLYQPQAMALRPPKKAAPPPMSTPKCLLGEDTEEGKKRAAKLKEK